MRNINGKTFFITGGAGFIGSHFTDILLDMGKEVIIFDNLSSGKLDFIKHHKKNPHLTFIKGDLLNQKQLASAINRNIDFVIHLAANPDISKGIEDPSVDYNQTIVATFNLLMEMKNKKVKKILFLSGSGVYGNVGDICTKEEFGPLLPVSMYGASKLSAEGLISAFSNLFKIKAWIFRPANIIGDRATHGVIFDFINKLKKNPSQLLILGDGNQSKSYLHISDVIDGIFLALGKSQDKINLFNIGSTSFITVNEIADIVIESMKLKDVAIKHTPGNIGWPGDVPIVRIDSKKLQDLGWNPRLSSGEAVKKTVLNLI